MSIKISELTEDTSPSSDDLIVTVNDPSGTPSNRKVTISNLFAHAAEITAPGITITGLTASLPVFTGTSKELVSKSVADTRTALGLGTTDSPAFAGLTINGNIATTGTVDGRDISADINQAVKTTDSPTFVGITLSGLTASLPVFTDTSKTLASKSIADTRTALGLGTTDSPTFAGLVVPSISPATDFVLNQNSVAVVTSVGTSAVANTIYLTAGKVGIGTTSPLAPLNVIAASSADQAKVQQWGYTAAQNSDTGYNLKLKTTVTTGVVAWTFDQVNDGTAYSDVMTFDRGRVGIRLTNTSYLLQLGIDSAAKPSTNTWTIASDERLKENIQFADLDRCYEIVKSLPLKRFTWRDDVYTLEQVKDRSKLGWISQDVQPIFPKSVDCKPFTVKKTRNEKVTDEVLVEDCLSLNADQIYATMYGAVQKLIEKVEALEALHEGKAKSQN